MKKVNLKLVILIIFLTILFLFLLFKTNTFIKTDKDNIISLDYDDKQVLSNLFKENIDCFESLDINLSREDNNLNLALYLKEGCKNINFKNTIFYSLQIISKYNNESEVLKYDYFGSFFNRYNLIYKLYYNNKNVLNANMQRGSHFLRFS